MQAYRKDDLYNNYVQEQATKAWQADFIIGESFNKILRSYPDKLYTPNYFIRIALGLLTLVAALFSGLLAFLLFSASTEGAIKALIIVLAILCYGTLEFLVKTKPYYNAGVDNVLLLLVFLFAVGFFFTLNREIDYLAVSSAALIVSLWLSIRFTDALMAIIAYACFFILVFLLYVKAGSMAKATAPFMMMMIAALVYFNLKKFNKGNLFIYRFCFKAVSLVTLITFYAAGNYFVVKELSNELFNLRLALHNPLTPGWIFWVFTLVIPPAYIGYGLLKKDMLLVRTGLVLTGASIFTIEYYYNFLAGEMEMLITGAILIILCYALTKYLTTPKYGYTANQFKRTKNEWANAEALAVSELGNAPPAVTNGPELFGGGSGGGGGATSQF